jgi:hypothetical protein
MARDIRIGVAGQKAKPKARPFALPGLPFRPPRPVPPRRAFPGAAGGLRVQPVKTRPIRVPVVHTAGPKPPPRRRPMAATPKAPIKAPAQASRGTASTIPQHAKTPAVKSHSLTDRTPAAKARPRAQPRRSVAPTRAATPFDPNATFDPNAGMSDQSLVDQQLAPLYLANDQELQAQQQFEQQRAAMIQAMTGGIMGQLGQLAPAVSSDYQGFVDRTNAAGRESGAALATATTDPQIKADLAAIGAPAEQVQQISDQNQNIFQGGGAVLSHVGGTVPAAAIAAEGAAQTAYARKLPAIAGLQGVQMLQSMLQEAATQRQQISGERAQIAARAPSLLQDILSSRASQAAKTRALDLEEAALRRQLGNDLFGRAVTKVKLKQSAQGLTLSGKRLKASTTLAQRRLDAQAAQQNLTNAFRFAEIYGFDPKTGKPTLAAVKAANADKAKAKKQAAKPPTATALSNWNKFAEDAYHGVAPKTRYDSGSGTFVPVPGTGKQPIEYYPALKRLLAMGATLTRAQTILGALYGKGEGGRPYVSLQGRLALERAGMPLVHTNAVPSPRQLAYLRAHGLWSD